MNWVILVTLYMGDPFVIPYKIFKYENACVKYVNNVDNDWPLRARLRFSHLPRARRWTVQDAMGDLYYSNDGKSTYSNIQLF